MYILKEKNADSILFRPTWKLQSCAHYLKPDKAAIVNKEGSSYCEVSPILQYFQEP